MSNKHTNILRYLGLVFLVIPATIMGLWMYAAGQGSTQAERVAVFHGYLPAFLHPYNVTSLLSLACCILAVVFSAISFSSDSGARRVVSLMVIIVGSLLFLLNLFGMM